MRKPRRVVVTGVGMITPLGLNTQTTWEAILAGKSGVAPISSLPLFKELNDFPSKIVASVRDFSPINYGISMKESRKMDLFIQYGLAATTEAIMDSKLEITEKNADRIGVAVGSGIGGLPFIEENNKKLLQKGKHHSKKIAPSFIPGAIINMLAGQISIMQKLKGPNFSVATACATGAHNIGLGARTIFCGDADVMVVGGAEMATTPLGLGGFVACRALSTRSNDKPEEASRPWDKERDGFVLGEGAGILILEEYERAKQRGVPIYAELVGFGMSADACHVTKPDPEGQGALSAMLNALNDANVEKEEIGHVNAHATSTPLGDQAELRALWRLFGEKVKKIAISGTKSMTGHLLAAAASVEAIFTVLALKNQIAPPTINLKNPGNPPSIGISDDRDYKGMNFVLEEPQELKKTKYALSNSFGFGGTNAALLFQAFY